MLQIGTRNAQNFELLKAVGAAAGLPGAVQARHGHHPRRVAQRLRVHRLERQQPHRLLPARHEDQLRRSAPQLRRLRPRAGGAAPHAPAGVHRPVALGRQEGRRPRRPARHPPRHRPGHHRRRQHGAGRLPSRSPRRRCATARRRCCSTSWSCSCATPSWCARRTSNASSCEALASKIDRQDAGNRRLAGTKERCGPAGRVLVLCGETAHA